MPGTIDLIIGLSFVFLLFSLVVTAANEIWLSFLDRRAAFLQEGLHELLQESSALRTSGWLRTAWRRLRPSRKPADSAPGPSPAEENAPGAETAAPSAPPGGAVDAIVQHGLVSALSRHGTSGQPTYIPADAFVSALLDYVCPLVAGADRSLADIREALTRRIDTRTINPRLGQSLLALLDSTRADIDQTRSDLQKFRDAITRWFEDSMNRVTGWYKRYAQTWLFVLAFLLAVGLNVDAIRLAQALYADPKLRDAVVAQATAFNGSPSDERPRDATAALEKYDRAVSTLQNASLPIGWASPFSQRLLRVFPTLEGVRNGTFTAQLFDLRILAPKLSSAFGLWGSALTGWLVTALAASLGAPFWFDTLQRFINLRANGRSPEEKDLKIRKSTTTPP